MGKTWNTLLEVVGKKSAEKLVSEFGGLRIYIPRKGDSKISAVIGDEAYSTLRAFVGGDYIEIPLLLQHKRMQRNLEIREYSRNGMPIADIAKKFSMTDKSIRAIIKGKEKPQNEFNSSSQSLVEICGNKEEDLWYMQRLKFQRIFREKQEALAS